MSYLVMARKYRPRTFSEVLGQGPIVTTLTNAIKQKKIGQAYLFAGPRGTGKTSTARIFAKALNCEKGPTAAPCLKCSRCEEITEGRSLDVLEIDGASNRGIDQIRSLRELAKFSPSSGTHKVYIIDEVHQITSEGFNALLKTLEEPPPHVLFILATTAAHKVPATILSRCQRFEFKRLPLKLIVEKLKGVSAEEKLKISEEAIAGIARAASGSLRDAESILDQVAAFAGGAAVKGEDLQTLLGTLPEDLFVEAMEGIQARDPVRLLRMVARCADSGTELVPWGLGLLAFTRNAVVAKIGAGPLGFEDLDPESVKRLSMLAEKFSLEELTDIADTLAGALETMRRVGEPRIPLEMALVRLSSAGGRVRVADLVARLEKLDQRLRTGTTPPPSSAVRAERVEARTEVPPSSAPKTASSPDLERIISVWPALMDRVHQKKAGTAGHLSHGQPVSFKAGNPPELVIGLGKGMEFSCQELGQLAARQLIEQSLAELLGHPVRCIFQISEELSGEAPKPDSGYVNSVLELFEGRMLPGES
jgi:DNA polymerase-3 subunit gamma/tau